MWKMTEKPKMVIATVPLVKEFYEMEPAPYDRPLSERRLQVYERVWRADEFRTVVWASAVVYETNCTNRVNGKHTSTILSGKTAAELAEHPMHVTVERYSCDTLKDLASLYNTFDSQLAGRTNRDVNLAFAAAIGLKEVPQKYVHLTVSAATNLKWDENELKRIGPAEKAEELLDRQDFVKWLTKVVPSCTSNRQRVNSPVHLLRAPVVTAMMATFDRGPENARKFWEAVRDETAASRDHSTRVLARYLVRTSLSGGGRHGTYRDRVVGYREMYVKCLHAWNAWRKGEATSLNYHSKAPVPEIVK